MSDLSRRDFLKASAGAVGASVAASRLHAAPRAREVPPSGAKVFTIFGYTNPSADDTSVVPTSDADLLARLEKNCPGIQFVARDLKQPGALESILNEMRDLGEQGYDGVLLFGAPRHYGLTETGLPIVIVSDAGRAQTRDGVRSFAPMLPPLLGRFALSRRVADRSVTRHRNCHSKTALSRLTPQKSLLTIGPKAFAEAATATPPRFPGRPVCQLCHVLRLGRPSRRPNRRRSFGP